MHGLMLVTDRALCGGRRMVDVAMQAVAGGVAAVQLREKALNTRAFMEEARALKTMLTGSPVPLIINDRVDVALAIDANGVHLGQEDMAARDARRILGRKAIIGLSVETWEDVVAAQELDVDYLGVSPVFATPTKTDTKGAWGLEGISRIRAFSRHPLVAIGGINAANAVDVVQAGAQGVAVVSAICAAPDPRQATAELCACIRQALFSTGPGHI